jgi:hypothetical protein
MGNLIGALFSSKSSSSKSSKKSHPSPEMTAVSPAPADQLPKLAKSAESAPKMTKKPSLGNVHAICPTGKEYEFMWKHDAANKVILTGSFDDWKQSIPLVKDKSQDVWRTTVLLDPKKRHCFKFVVDGVWRCSLDFGTTTDASGNVNNVIEPKD